MTDAGRGSGRPRLSLRERLDAYEKLMRLDKPIGTLLLLWPVMTALGAMMLLIVSIGAALAQLFVLHEDVIHAIVLAAPLAAIVWAHRDQLGGLDS